MASQRVSHTPRFLGAATILLSSLACAPEIPTGHFVCAAPSDCPDEWFCWNDGFCYDTPEASGGDASIERDAEARDALPTDARADTGVRSDAGADAAVEDSATPDAGCSRRFGEPCTIPGQCGAVIDCAGECVAGEVEPVCSCEASVCLPDGTWSACTEPANFGQLCSGGDTCGGTIDCMGVCSGGSPRPPCACGDGVCGPSGSWTCPGPSNYGQGCDTATSCGGSIDCNGTCSGGAPLPLCECGTATCGGCVGGTCGANSQCVSGSCVCTVSNCACPTGGASTCAACLPTGNLGTCAVDAFGCGDFTGAEQACTYGCTAANPAVCACHPQTGQSCSTQTCSCWCGTFQNFGATDCDGGCTPDYPSCGLLCQDFCGDFCPRPPCIDPD